MQSDEILLVGGYGVVGTLLAAQLEAMHSGHVLVAGRHPERAAGKRVTQLDLDNPKSVEAGLENVRVVIACVRQRESHLLRAAVRRGLAYTSIAPPRMNWSELQTLHAEARRTGARIVAATGLEPGISSILARVGATRLGRVDAVETALLLGIGDEYGADSMTFLLEEIAHPYTVVVNGRAEIAHAFVGSARVTFPEPIGSRRAYSMAFTDQLYYPMTLGAKAAVARLALDPPWLGAAIAGVASVGAAAWATRDGGPQGMRLITERLRHRYRGRDEFALVVDVRAGDRTVRSTLVGKGQARATAAGATATVEALYRDEVPEPGVWLPEQVLSPERFLARLAEHGSVPVVREWSSLSERDAELPASTF
jgi:saccharopine dehydrogenase-like NADP-dependent oxidoreductase